ncbi:MAG: FCD domain-containing protein [Pseudomonadota bacterium]
MRTLSIKIPNVSESLEEKLEAMILRGAFWPDRPIASERRLAEEFDVSRTSLRNALASLLSRGLLSKTGTRYYTTNIMADVFGPGLGQIAVQDPKPLLDYWVLLFENAVALAREKAQGKDSLAINEAAGQLQMALKSGQPQAMSEAFSTLSRAIFDGCYNFFLSQTHHALMGVMQPYVEQSFALLAQSPKREDLLTSVEGLAESRFDVGPLYEGLEPGFRPQASGAHEIAASKDIDPEDVDASPLVDIVSRNPLFLEAVYELRLITETHAAAAAAEHLSGEQQGQLEAHLTYMKAFEDGAARRYSKLDTELHRLIAEGAQNPVFAFVDAALSPVFSRTTNQWLSKHLEIRSDQSAIHMQHKQIVDAITMRNGPKARAAMTEHLAYVLRNLRHLRELDQLQEIALARELLR